ncbi:MAG: matrixin family metalloprotease [Marmoricola sp.]
MHERRDPTTILAAAITLAAVIGFVIAVPSVLPAGLRNLVGLGPHRQVAARSVGQSTGFAFLAHQRGNRDSPVGYDPCKVIHVVMNPREAPSYGLALVKQAMAEVGERSGLRFVYDGTTNRRQQWQGESTPVLLGIPRSRPVLVSWSTGAETHELAGSVAGLGGSAALPDNGGYLRFFTGGITLDSQDFARMEQQPDGQAEQLAVVLHEFGHVVGLAHVKDPDALMNPAPHVTSFSPGDLAGLARVGRTSCA